MTSPGDVVRQVKRPEEDREQDAMVNMTAELTVGAISFNLRRTNQFTNTLWQLRSNELCAT